jgi:hypothetical protein
MKQKDEFQYTVIGGEEVTLTFNPKNGAPNLITAVLDEDLGRDVSAGPKPTFTFNVTKPVGETHRCRVECDFQDAPDEAFIEVTLEGSKDTETFKSFITRGLPDPLYRFRVVVKSAES